LAPTTGAAFEKPTGMSDLNEENAIALNVHDSTLFNDELAERVRDQKEKEE